MGYDIKKIALAGNPNSGKSTVFNLLTGLNQQVGNYPGVTVDRKKGYFKLEHKKQVELIDLPGTYSLYPRSEDEKVVYDLLTNPQHEDFPDLVVVVVDASNLERHLLLFSQIYDLKIPTVLALNMIDRSEKKGITLDETKISGLLGNVPVVSLNARKGQGLDQLKAIINTYQPVDRHYPFISKEEQLLLHQQLQNKKKLKEEGGDVITEVIPLSDPIEGLPDQEQQIEETKIRFQKINDLLRFTVKHKGPGAIDKTRSLQLDRFFVHPIGGYVIFMLLLFAMFQAVYSLAEWPMDIIDNVFFELSQWCKTVLPSGVLFDLIAEGVIPGIGGVVIFIPQIVLLFFFIAVLEESGYMARVVFIMDKLMRPFGLNGKSVVPMMSGLACAVPAIMATRTISNWKERMITIMITPLMSCAARLPVYTLLIALVIPDQTIFGIINLKGLALLGLYLVGLFAALLAAVVFRFILKSKSASFLVLELPAYRMPRWKNILATLWEKATIFVLEAGKVILAISIVLWVLASYGPGNRIERAVSAIPAPISEEAAVVEEYENQVSSAKLENSWIGILGKGIEPVIAPLGYDWKIGIALLTSFAAREVFVGSMATIYSVGEDFEGESTLLDRMRQEINPRTQQPVYTLATGISLMLFYVFAMQCMSTLAIVYRETRSIKWPVIQLVYMTSLAYIVAYIAYQFLKI